MEKVEKLKEIDRARFEAFADAMEEKYKKVSSIDNKDIAKLKRDLLAQWKHIEAEAKKGATKGKKAVKKKSTRKKSTKKTAKKAAKKTTKKAVKKKTKKS